MEILNFQYSGVLSDPFSVKCIIALVFAVVLYLYLIIKQLVIAKKEKRSLLNVGTVSFLVYLAVILAAWILSQKTEILYSRYLLVITGFLILDWHISYLKKRM